MIDSFRRKTLAWERINRRAGLIGLFVGTSLLSSCGLSGGESDEAKRLASTLKRLAPEAKALLAQEHATANELKITLDEAAGKVGTPDFSAHVSAYLDTLIAMREKRREIQETVRQSVWQSAMVHVVQHDAVVMLQDEINRNASWIQFVRNIRTRAEIGRQDKAPEWDLLIKELDGFLALTDEDPLSTQVRSLQEEFRFGESEIRP